MPVLAEHSAAHTEGMYRDSNFVQSRYQAESIDAKWFKRYKRRSKYTHKLPGKSRVEVPRKLPPQVPVPTTQTTPQPSPSTSTNSDA